MTKLKAYRHGNIVGWLVEDLFDADSEKIFSRPGTFLNKPDRVFKQENDKITLLIKAPILVPRKSLVSTKKPPVFWLVKSSQIKFNFIIKGAFRWHYRQKNKSRLATINTLVEKKLPVPYIYAWLWEKGDIDRYYLISEGFSEASNLALIAREQKQLFDQLIEQGLLAKLVQAMAAFHQCGYSHGDMKWSNIVILADRSFRFVDLDHVKKSIFGHKQGLFLKDLARFLIGAFEAGLDEAQLTDIVLKYAECRRLNYNALIKKIMPKINKISARKNIQQLKFETKRL